MSEHAHKPKPKSVAQAPTKMVAPTTNPRPLGSQRKPTIAPAKPTATAPDQKDVRRLPDGKNIEERLGYLRFMINQIGDEAEAVWKLSK